MTSSPFTALCIILIVQGVQAWWYPSYGYGFNHYHPYGPLPYHPAYYPPYHPPYHPPPYPPYSYPHYGVYHAYSTSRGAQIGAAIGSLAAHIGKK